MLRPPLRTWSALCLMVGLACSAAPPAAAGSSTDPFPAFKARMLKLFKDCSYLNISIPDGRGAAVNPREEARAQWQTMTHEIERAEKGWKVSWDPRAITLRCEVDSTTWGMVEVYYLGGMLGLENSPVSLKVGPGFRKAIYEMVAIGHQREAEWNARPENPDSWPVNMDQARGIASAFATAAGLEPGGHMSGNTEPPHKGERPRITIEFPGVARLVIDGQDGSILRAVNLSAAPRAASPIGKEQALATGQRIASAMGVTGEPASLEQVKGQRGWVWELVWRGPGAERADARFDVDTGAFASAEESLRAAHPRVPTRAEVAPPASAPPPPPPPSPQPKPGAVRLSAEQAKPIAGAFAKRLDLPFGDGATVKYRDPDQEYLRPPTWAVEFYNFSIFNIDANTGKVVGFGNFSAASAAPVKGIPISEAAAKAAAVKAIQALGLPRDAVFGEAKYADHGDAPADWVVRWCRQTPEGVPFEDDAAYVLVRATTGVAWSASLRWSSHLPENTKITITKEQAIETAHAFAREKEGLVAAPAFTAELKVVHPNAYWSKEPVRHVRYDSSTRVAWAVTLTQTGARAAYEMIFWVDASTGQILGGTQSSGGIVPAAGTTHRAVLSVPSPSGASPARKLTTASLLKVALATAVVMVIIIVAASRSRRRGAAAVLIRDGTPNTDSS